MEIRDLAERVLFGTRLDDKLVGAERFTDEQPGPALARVPEGPVRPAGLALVRRARTEFPAVAHFDRAEVRGRALHAFALHELLAMEVMALLRFPEAPPAFRRGLATALVEEQTHFRLYHQRMAACGIELGEVPANAHFWDSLAGMQQPLDFVLGMSLTFEQANLDHSAFYQRAFARVGDTASADVMRQVYEDEIGHVKLGLVWFRRWLDQPTDEWAAYTTHLPEPLHPGRARGAEFDAEGRQRAGFSPEFIERIRVFTRSRGRVPALWSFDPAAELRAAGALVPPIVQQLQRDLETLPMFLAAGDDAIRVSRPPRPAFLASLADAGFALPEFVTDPTDRRFRAHHAWADPATPAALFSKAWSVAELGNLLNLNQLPGFPASLVGQVCTTADEVADHHTRIRATGHAVVAKAAFGTAGRGLVVLGEALPRRWLATALAEGPVVVEPWLDRVLDLGLQLTVGDDAVRFDGTTRNLVDTRGHHRGVALVRGGDALPEDLRRFVLQPATQAVLDATVQHVGAALRQAGHRGFAGIDALVFRTAHGYGLKPIVEVNPRTTMGRVGLALRKRVAPGTFAAWVQGPVDTLTAVRPRLRGSPPQIEDGVLFTTDPEGARFTTALVVSPSLEGLRARLAGWVVVDPLLAHPGHSTEPV